MQQLLQISFRGLGRSAAIENRIRSKAKVLERFAADITSCRVTVELLSKHHHKGDLYAVQIDLHLPGKEIVIGRERRHPRDDVYVALREAFDAAVRQLEDYVRKRRGHVKQHAVPNHGRIVRLYGHEGYGFVQTADGTEVYFHENSVNAVPFSTLAIGDEVRIVVAEGEGERGPQASSVTPIGKHHIVGQAT